MSKTKQPRRPVRTDLHAISPLPIDFIHQRLDVLRKRGLDMQFVVMNEDEVWFQMKHPKMRSVATGTLRRWEGTNTRIDANTALQVPPVWIEWVAQLAVIGFLTLWFGGCTVASGFVSFITCAGSVMVATAISLLMPISKFFERFRLRALQDAEKQMNIIAHILTHNLPEGSAPLLEFDGSEDTLNRLLTQQRDSRGQFGSDGEAQ